MTGAGVVLLTTFLASSVEAIEMVIIVLGVGAARGWRSTLVGAAAGLVVLAADMASADAGRDSGSADSACWMMRSRRGLTSGTSIDGFGGCPSSRS